MWVWWRGQAWAVCSPQTARVGVWEVVEEEGKQLPQWICLGGVLRGK